MNCVFAKFSDDSHLHKDNYPAPILPKEPLLALLSLASLFLHHLDASIVVGCLSVGGTISKLMNVNRDCKRRSTTTLRVISTECISPPVLEA